MDERIARVNLVAPAPMVVAVDALAVERGTTSSWIWREAVRAYLDGAGRWPAGAVSQLRTGPRVGR